MKIKFNDLGAQWDNIKSAALPTLESFLEGGWYIGGKPIDEFEEAFAEYIGTNYAIGVSNGTDALKLCIQVLNLQGSVEVIMPANGYIADPLSVWYQTGKNSTYCITLIDCDEYYQIDVDKLEDYLSSRYHEDGPRRFDHTIILPVHLYGHPVNMKKLMQSATKYDCHVIEDASQAHGAECYNKKVGTYGCLTAYSLYPGKNLGAMGDAGVITTSLPEYANHLKMLRNYGSSVKYHFDDYGWNNRLDPLQAIFLTYKLKFLDLWNMQRNNFGKMYNELLSDVPEVTIPKTAPYVTRNVYHLYPIRVKDRGSLQDYLNAHDVPTVIHYPIPIQKTKIFQFLPYRDSDNPNTVKYADELLSLPLHPFLDHEQVNYVVDTIKDYYATNKV